MTQRSVPAGVTIALLRGRAMRKGHDCDVPGAEPCAGGGVCRVDGNRIDVRRQPLVVRDGCAPDRTPAGRWPSDGALVRSEQFAVNEALASLAPGGAGG